MINNHEVDHSLLSHVDDEQEIPNTDCFSDIPREQLAKVFSEVSAEMLAALKNNATYGDKVFEAYFEHGVVPSGIRFQDGGYEWKVIRTGADNKDYFSQKDKEVRIMRRKVSIPEDETEDQKWDRQQEELRREDLDPFFWEEKLTFGADYSTRRDGAGVARYEAGRKEFHDPEMTFLSEKFRRHEKTEDGREYFWSLRNKMIVVEKAQEMMRALGYHPTESVIPSPGMRNITPRRSAIDVPSTASLSLPSEEK